MEKRKLTTKDVRDIRNEARRELAGEYNADVIGKLKKYRVIGARPPLCGNGEVVVLASATEAVVVAKDDGECWSTWPARVI